MGIGSRDDSSVLGEGSNDGKGDGQLTRHACERAEQGRREGEDEEFETSANANA